jgi:hypothetical protein
MAGTSGSSHGSSDGAVAGGSAELVFMDGALMGIDTPMSTSAAMEACAERPEHMAAASSERLGRAGDRHTGCRASRTEHERASGPGPTGRLSNSRSR